MRKNKLHPVNQDLGTHLIQGSALVNQPIVIGSEVSYFFDNRVIKVLFQALSISPGDKNLLDCFHHLELNNDPVLPLEERGKAIQTQHFILCLRLKSLRPNLFQQYYPEKGVNLLIGNLAKHRWAYK